MGTKKQAEKSKKMWIKILAVIACVFFAVVMVLSSMGSSWIASFATVKPGDVAVVDYTLRDAQGTPIMTSNQQLYTQLTSQGSGLLYSKPLTITANQSFGTKIYPIAFYTSSSGWSSQNQFALLSTEYNTISSGIVGMKANSQKTISLVDASPQPTFWSNDKLALNGMNSSSLQAGEFIYLAMNQTDSSAQSYVRIGEVTNKTADGVTIDISYPSIDVTIDSINAASS